MQPKRILQVLTTMNRGGAETMIMNYYRAIDRTKVQFDFLLHRNEESAYDKEILQLGGKIYRVPSITPINYIKYKEALSLFFSKHQDYIIVHSHLNALSGIILGVARKKGVPVRISHSHLAVQPYILKKIFNKNTDVTAIIKDSIQTLIRKSVRKNSTHFFACGIKAGNWLFGKENASKVTIINNAIDVSKFTFSEKEREKIRKSLIIKDEKIIGHVGRFNEQKNHFFLIKIFKEIVSQDENVVLVLVGVGGLRSKIEDEVNKLGIRNKVRFLGLRDDIPNLLQAFDIFLFPSLYEGLPVTLVEAQAAGLRIVTSNRVTTEVDITQLVTFLSLGISSKEWASVVINNLDYKRRNTNKMIADGSYDVYTNALKLQNFYLDVWN